MKHRMKYLSLFFLLAGSLLFSASAWAQNVLPGPGWQVVKADWGAGNRWMNVTNQLRRLLSGNGPVRVNNANMGGDPAVGASKILRDVAVLPVGCELHVNQRSRLYVAGVSRAFR